VEDADLVAYREDPTKNLGFLRHPALVIHGGEVTQKASHSSERLCTSPP
jgi:imidazolonepropionase-like amidohydrolase